MRTVEEIEARFEKDLNERKDRLDKQGDPTNGEIVEFKDAIRWLEICAAEKDGRLVVLPCKRGDSVFRLCGGSKKTKYVGERIVMSVEINGPTIIIHSTADDILGKTVFLTRAEAEAALKGTEHERD